MLGVLIPGVREIRAALLSGTLLMLSAYLLLFDFTSTAFDRDRVSPALESVYDLVGRTGLLVAAGIVAYLVGTALTRLVNRRMRVWQVALIPKIVAPSYMPPSRKPYAVAFQAPFSRPSIKRVLALCQRRNVSAESVLSEIVLSGGKRLLGANRDLYTDYDRLQSEAEFRLAVALPSLLLSVAIALQVPGHLMVEIGAVLVVSVMLFFVIGDALAIQREANSMYAHFVVDGFVSTPTLDADTSAPSVPEAD